MNSRSMLRRLNRLFPPPDPRALALQEVREFFKFATYKEKDELGALFNSMGVGINRTGAEITSWEQLAERDPRGFQRVKSVLTAIAARRASGVKPSWEERLSPRLRWRAEAFAERERAEEERSMK